MRDPARAHRRQFADGATLAQALADDLAAQRCQAITARGHALIAVSGGNLAQAAVGMPLPCTAALEARHDGAGPRALDAGDAPRHQRPHDPRTSPAGPRGRCPLRADEERRRDPAVWPACVLSDAEVPAAAVRRLAGRHERRRSHRFSFAAGPRTVEALLQDSPLCLAVGVPSLPQAPYARMSLCLSGLADTPRCVLVPQGLGKLEMPRNAQQAGPVEQMPIRALLRQAHPALEIWSAP